jgi:hypothetical protein
MATMHPSQPIGRPGAGYADQAHLTKDISELAATTPARLVAERAGVSGGPLSM